MAKNILKFVFDSRGMGNLVKRTFQVATRFGPGPKKMGGRFERFMDVLDEFGIQPTFPITALPMSRNPEFAHRLIERGAELAVHAHTHTDLSALTYEEQTRHMSQAIQLFRKHAVPFTGFRAPYLHWNADTMRVVEDYQFRYDSNQAVLWDVVDLESQGAAARDGWDKARAFYNPLDAADTVVLPFRRRGFVEIPVSLPDDEILHDRMYIHSAEFLGETWMKIFEHTYQRGELFTLQLHPERIDFFANALRALLSTARNKKPAVWIATLESIAAWWVDKAQNRADFVRDGDYYRVDVKAAPGATVLLRENGAERAVEPGELRVPAPDGLRPCVGVAPGSNREAIQRLADFGYIIEAGDAAADFVVHLGILRDGGAPAIREHLAEIEECPGPLVRFATWPHGNKSALSVTGDIDALTIWDFLHRFRGA